MHQPAMPLRPGSEHCSFQTDRRLRRHATHPYFQLEGTVPLQEMQTASAEGLLGGEVAGLTGRNLGASIEPFAGLSCGSAYCNGLKITRAWRRGSRRSAQSSHLRSRSTFLGSSIATRLLRAGSMK